jgi:hypothetical protein
VHVTGWPLVGRRHDEVGEHTTRLVALDHQRRRDRVTDADDRVSPRHSVATGGVAHPERTVDLLGPQPCGRRVDLGLDRRHLVGVDLGPDRRVHQIANRIGERLVHGAHPVDLLRGEVPDMGELQHHRTRTCF